MGRKTRVAMAGLAMCLAAGGVFAGEAPLPRPENATLVLPKGTERTVYPAASRLGGSLEQMTAAGLSWDDDGLTAVVDCDDRSVVAAQGRRRDEPAAWKDDGVELLLDPGHAHGTPLTILVTAAGAVRDARGADASFDVAGLEARTVRTARGWRATLFVPWKGLGVAAPAPGDVWGLNIRRTEQSEPASAGTMTVASWLPLETTDPQEVLGNGQVAFVLPEALEDDAALAAVRGKVAAGHAAAVRAWAGPNEGDVLALGAEPLVVPRLGLAGSGAPPRQATRVTLAREAAGLAVRFDCDDADVLAAQEGRDNIKLWKDDCVYVFLDPGHAHAADGAPAVMVQVSAAGVVHDARGGDAAWNLEGLLARTERTAAGWSAQLLLPWRGLGAAAPRDGDMWGVNLARMDQPGKADFANMEMSSLVVAPGGDPQAHRRWGHLAFGATGDPAASPAHAALRAALDRRLAAEAAAAKAVQERLAATRGLPANPQASEDVHKMVAWLAGLPERKGKRLIVGQAGGEQHFDIQMQAVHEKSGKWPAMLHVSLVDPRSAFDLKQAPQGNASSIRYATSYWKAGGLVHIHVNPVNPWNDRHIFEPDKLAGRERLAEVLQPGTKANLAWMRTLDAFAAGLAELRDAGVVVFWRPLHEMGFTSMYWYDAGATPDREVFKDIWRHMFRYFSYEKQLDNLVWVFGAGGGPASFDMYPGEAYVDLVGFSLYSPSVIAVRNEYDRLLELGKPFAFTEFGNYVGNGLPGDALDLVRGVRELYPRTTFAVYWGSWPGTPASLADSRNVDKLMHHPWVLGREDLDWRDTKVDLARSRARAPAHKAFDFGAHQVAP